MINISVFMDGEALVDYVMQKKNKILETKRGFKALFL